MASDGRSKRGSDILANEEFAQAKDSHVSSPTNLHEIPRSPFSIDSLRSGMRALTLSEIENEFESGNYTYTASPGVGNGHFTVAVAAEGSPSKKTDLPTKQLQGGAVASSSVQRHSRELPKEHLSEAESMLDQTQSRSPQEALLSEATHPTSVTDVDLQCKQDSVLTQSVLGAGDWACEALAALPFRHANADSDALDLSPGENIQACTGGYKASGSGYSNSDGLSGFNDSWNSAPNGDKSHHKRPSGDDSGSAGDGDSSGPPQTSKKAKMTYGLGRSFSCPFAKREPRFYNKGVFKNCTFGAGFKDIAKLKEHIGRVHTLQKPRCVRCGDQFADQKDLDFHTQSIEVNGCTNLQPPLPKGFLPQDKWQSISRRKSKYGGEPVARWNFLYQQLFPDAQPPLPSPYHTTSTQNVIQNQSIESLIRSFESGLSEVLQRRLHVAMEADPFDPGLTEPLNALFRTLLLETIEPGVQEVAANIRAQYSPISLCGSRSSPNIQRNSHAESGAGSATDSGYQSMLPACLGCQLEFCPYCTQLSTSSYSGHLSSDFQPDCSPSPVSPGSQTLDPRRVSLQIDPRVFDSDCRGLIDHRDFSDGGKNM